MSPLAILIDTLQAHHAIKGQFGEKGMRAVESRYICMRDNTWKLAGLEIACSAKLSFNLRDRRPPWWLEPPPVSTSSGLRLSVTFSRLLANRLSAPKVFCRPEINAEYTADAGQALDRTLGIRPEV